MRPNGLDSGFLIANGVRLHYARQGSGRLVLFLHGFPQCWYAWRKILPRMAIFTQAVALDLRGYNESDKPIRVGDYSMEALVGDVAHAIRALGASRATVVGHDWGGAVAWELAGRHPDLVDRLAVLNCPHPAALRRRLLRSAGQLARSWYMLFFQLPGLPEAVLGRDSCAFLDRLFRPSGLEGALTDDDIAFYRRALSRPGALSAALNYYRAAFRGALVDGHSSPIVRRPTLLLWGEKDPVLGPELIDETRRYASDLEVRILPGGHWLPEEAPGAVERALLEFLGVLPRAGSTVAP